MRSRIVGYFLSAIWLGMETYIHTLNTTSALEKFAYLKSVGSRRSHLCWLVMSRRVRWSGAKQSAVFGKAAALARWRLWQGGGFGGAEKLAQASNHWNHAIRVPCAPIMLVVHDYTARLLLARPHRRSIERVDDLRAGILFSLLRSECRFFKQCAPLMRRH